MLDLAIKVAVNAAALVVAATYVPDVRLNPRDKLEDWVMIALIALIFALVNSYLRPVLRFLAMPAGFMTIGLVAFVINAAMLLLTAWLVNIQQVQDLLKSSFAFQVGGYPPTWDYAAVAAVVVASIVISIVATLLETVLLPRRVIGL